MNKSQHKKIHCRHFYKDINLIFVEDQTITHGENNMKKRNQKILAILLLTGIISFSPVMASAAEDELLPDTNDYDISETDTTPDTEDTSETDSGKDLEYQIQNGTWIKSGKRWWFRFADKTYPTDCILKIKGIYYGFDKEGWMVTGWYRYTDVDENGKTYSEWYFFNDNGSMKTGWLKNGGRWYYLDSEDGTMYADGSAEINQKTYLFTKSGALFTGWYKSASDSKTIWYYFTDYGMVTGWEKINNIWYYFDPDSGVMYSDGLYAIGNAVYAFKPSGAMVTGWYKDTYVDEDGISQTVWYFFDTNGAMHKGWLDWNGEIYYLDPSSGIMYADGIYTVEGRDRWFEASGVMRRGWKQIDVVYEDGTTGKEWTHCSDYGHPSKNGWLLDKGKHYYFIDYIMIHSCTYTIDDKTYIFRDSGARVEGWFYYDGEWYYFDEEGQPYDGWLTYKGDRYYIRNGKMCTGVVRLDYWDFRYYKFSDNGVFIGECDANGVLLPTLPRQ